MTQHGYSAKKRIGDVEVEFTSTDFEAVKEFINKDFSKSDEKSDVASGTHWQLVTHLDGENIGSSFFPTKVQADAGKAFAENLYDLLGMEVEFTLFEVSGSIDAPYGQDAEGNIVSLDEAAALWKEVLDNA